jgi:hypothetical protein
MTLITTPPIQLSIVEISTIRSAGGKGNTPAALFIAEFPTYRHPNTRDHAFPSILGFWEEGRRVCDDVQRGRWCGGK